MAKLTVPFLSQGVGVGGTERVQREWRGGGFGTETTRGRRGGVMRERVRRKRGE